MISQLLEFCYVLECAVNSSMYRSFLSMVWSLMAFLLRFNDQLILTLMPFDGSLVHCSILAGGAVHHVTLWVSTYPFTTRFDEKSSCRLSRLGVCSRFLPTKNVFCCSHCHCGFVLLWRDQLVFSSFVQECFARPLFCEFVLCQLTLTDWLIKATPFSQCEVHNCLSGMYHRLQCIMGGQSPELKQKLKNKKQKIMKYWNVFGINITGTLMSNPLKFWSHCD